MNLPFLQLNYKTTECPLFCLALQGSHRPRDTLVSQHNTSVQLPSVLKHFLLCCIICKQSTLKALLDGLFPLKQDCLTRNKGFIRNPKLASQQHNASNGKSITWHLENLSRNSHIIQSVNVFKTQTVLFHTLLCRVSESRHW